MKKFITAAISIICALCAVSCTASKEENVPVSMFESDVPTIVTDLGLRYQLVRSLTKEDYYTKWFNGTFYNDDYELMEGNTISEEEAREYYSYPMGGNKIVVCRDTLTTKKVSVYPNASGNSYESRVDIIVTTLKYVLIDVRNVYEIKDISEFVDHYEKWVKTALSASEDGKKNVCFVFRTPSEEQSLFVNFTEDSDGIYYTAKRQYTIEKSKSEKEVLSGRKASLTYYTVMETPLVPKTKYVASSRQKRIKILSKSRDGEEAYCYMKMDM